jgi:hypothetical protein
MFLVDDASVEKGGGGFSAKILLALRSARCASFIVIG